MDLSYVDTFMHKNLSGLITIIAEAAPDELNDGKPAEARGSIYGGLIDQRGLSRHIQSLNVDQLVGKSSLGSELKALLKLHYGLFFRRRILIIKRAIIPSVGNIGRTDVSHGGFHFFNSIVLLHLSKLSTRVVV